MKNYILQKTEKWPKNWDIHIINSCKLYFENKKITFIDGHSNGVAIVSAIKCSINSDALGFGCDGVNLNLFFNNNNYNYSISLYRNNKKNVISGYIYYETFVPFTYDNFDDIFFEVMTTGSSFVNCNYMISEIEEKTSFDIIKQLEKIIKRDYNNRKKDDNGNEGNDENPVKPKNPVENLDLKPSYSIK